MAMLLKTICYRWKWPIINNCVWHFICRQWLQSRFFRKFAPRNTERNQEPDMKTSINFRKHEIAVWQTIIAICFSSVSFFLRLFSLSFVCLLPKASNSRSVVPVISMSTSLHPKYTIYHFHMWFTLTFFWLFSFRLMWFYRLFSIGRYTVNRIILPLYTTSISQTIQAMCEMISMWKSTRFFQSERKECEWMSWKTQQHLYSLTHMNSQRQCYPFCDFTFLLILFFPW